MVIDAISDFSEGLFRRVPEDLVRHIFSFADVCSLGRIAQVSKSFLSTSASDDATWTDYVQRRFQLDTSKSRAKTHGGNTWKEVYHILSKCNRIPKSRFTSTRKVIFAKGGGITQKCNSAVAVWVLLSHTEDCLTRRSAFGNGVSDVQSRFVELHICVQNVKSSQGNVQVNMIDSKLELMGNVDSGRPHQYGRMKPRLLHRSRQVDMLAQPLRNVDTLNLHPLEFCIVSMHFPCQDDIYETDVLSRAVSFSVPFSSAHDQPPQVVKARFIDDSDIWNHYVELPGACLTLNDRSRHLGL